MHRRLDELWELGRKVTLGSNVLIEHFHRHRWEILEDKPVVQQLGGVLIIKRCSRGHFIHISDEDKANAARDAESIKCVDSSIVANIVDILVDINTIGHFDHSFVCAIGDE